MVFDPTFHEISEEADALPDLEETDAPPLEDVDPADLPPEGAQ